MGVELTQKRLKELKAVSARWEAEKKYKFPDCSTKSTAYLYLKERNVA
jgi:hypothetical protein